MSNAVYPTLPGLTFNVKKTPKYNTSIQPAVSGMETRVAFMAYPMWTFGLSYEFLRDGNVNGSVWSEFDQLTGFFLARQGSFDSFLFTDPDDSTVTDQSIGTGNGGTQFQLLRTAGNGANSTFNEPVQNVNAITNIKSNGVATSNYTVNANGLVTFNSATANGATLTWTGSFYYRVRFTADSAEFNKFMYNLWELKQVELYGSPANKV